MRVCVLFQIINFHHHGKSVKHVTSSYEGEMVQCEIGVMKSKTMQIIHRSLKRTASQSFHKEN